MALTLARRKALGQHRLTKRSRIKLHNIYIPKGLVGYHRVTPLQLRKFTLWVDGFPPWHIGAGGRGRLELLRLGAALGPL
jgi:hypothetical protein